jgi:hypothetical protein
MSPWRGVPNGRKPAAGTKVEPALTPSILPLSTALLGNASPGRQSQARPWVCSTRTRAAPINPPADARTREPGSDEQSAVLVGHPELIEITSGRIYSRPLTPLMSCICDSKRRDFGEGGR